MENTKQVSGSVMSITSQVSQQTAVSGEISASISGISNNKKEVVDSAKATNQTAAEISDLGKAINGSKSVQGINRTPAKVDPLLPEWSTLI